MPRPIDVVCVVTPVVTRLFAAVLVGALLVGAVHSVGGCAASPPPLEAHERAFAGEHGRLSLEDFDCVLPVERFVSVELRFEGGTVYFEGAPMGASLESLADDEAEVLRLTTGHEPERARVFVQGKSVVELVAGSRRALVTMPTPWRVVRARGERLPTFVEGATTCVATTCFAAPGAFVGGVLRGREGETPLRPGARPEGCDQRAQ